jgi:hypothetical protein
LAYQANTTEPCPGQWSSLMIPVRPTFWKTVCPLQCPQVGVLKCLVVMGMGVLS